MRPIKLEIEGLQSFEKRQVIDFERLTEEGLFGIFGKTGSGKSTILDAITLALYGNIVRIDNSREDRLENLLNINSDKIEVTYEFSIGESVYKIYRRFPKKRSGDGLGKQKCNMLKNGEVIADKTGEIKNRVDELIGLNMDDFTRSVVLPQGKFSEFLKLAGREKREMLERIFGLEKYGRKFIEKLTLEKRSKRSEIEALENQIKGKGDINREQVEIKKRELETLNQAQEKFNKVYGEFQKQYREKEEVKKLSDELERHKQIEKGLDKRKEEIADLKDKISKSEKANEIGELNIKKEQKERELKDKKREREIELRELEKKRDKKKRLESEKRGHAEDEKKYEKLGREFEVDPKDRERVNGIIRLKENIENKIDIKGEKEKKLESEKDKLSSLEKRLEEKKGKLSEINRQLEELNNIEKEDITSLKLKNGKLKSEIDEVKELERDIKKLKGDLEREIGEKEKLRVEIEKVKELIKEEEIKILNDKAYSLAKELKSGESCPVCGSKEHPNLAKPSFDIDEKRLDKLKRELENLNSKYYKLNPKKLEGELEEKLKKLDGHNSKELMEQFESEEKEIDEKEKKNRKLEEKLKRLEKERNSLDKEIVGIYRDLENGMKNIRSYQDEIKKLNLELGNIERELKDKFDLELVEESLEKLKEKYKKLIENEKKSNSYKDLEKEARDKKEKILIGITKLNGEISKIESKLSSLDTQLKILVERLEEIQEGIDEAIKNSDFRTLEEALNSIISEEKIEKFNNEIMDYNKKVTENSAIIKNIEEKLNGKTITLKEWKELEKEKLKKENRAEEIKERVLTLNKDISNMEKILEEIEELLKDKKELEHKYHILEDLSKLFKGNAFVEYLAIGKLKNITKHASSRLNKITSNRYGIEVGENGEFLIVDNFNNGIKRRSATLSGGETFLVSLSLALALSNQIQLKGKSNLEFFFLDEGFGTLDSETLERVISSLETLKDSEKLKVGIITHVEEIKDRVPRKLEVLEPISGERGSKIDCYGCCK